MSDEPQYRVRLEAYSGPLDLLLYLIRREEVDIYDIPIAKITEQYCQYIEMIRQVDPDSVGQFLVMAATLMEIKSRMLLPKPPEETPDEEEIDPRAELVRQLLEYKKYKDAAERLKQRVEEFSRRWPRPKPPGLPAEGVELEDASVWDLLAAFNRLMVQTGRVGPSHEIVYDDTPVVVHAARIVETLQKAGGAAKFAVIFAGRSRAECIGLFLALLELIRRRRVRAEQDRPFGQIYIFLIDARPLTAEEIAESYGPAGGEFRETDQQGPAEASSATDNRMGASDDGASADRVQDDARSDGQTPQQID